MGRLKEVDMGSHDEKNVPPLPRIVGEGDSGLDVMVYREALVALGLVPAADRGWFGPGMVAGVLAFQRRAGITQTGTIGNRTYELLYRQIPAGGRRSLKTFGRRWAVRERMVAEQQWGLANAAQIHYPPHDDRVAGETATAIERWQEHELPIMLDCSEYATCIARAAGAPDPTDTGWGAHGPVFTGTMLTGCRKIEKDQLKPGDYVVFGERTGEHACVVLSIENPGDPELTSHGKDIGPLRIALSEESRAHNQPVTFLAAVK
jgi:peptidoglycan hydrolase-like protein with peptidoglycan-binding domain